MTSPSDSIAAFFGGRIPIYHRPLPYGNRRLLRTHHQVNLTRTSNSSVVSRNFPRSDSVIVSVPISVLDRVVNSDRTMVPFLPKGRHQRRGRVPPRLTIIVRIRVRTITPRFLIVATFTKHVPSRRRVMTLLTRPNQNVHRILNLTRVKVNVGSVVHLQISSNRLFLRVIRLFPIRSRTITSMNLFPMLLLLNLERPH